MIRRSPNGLICIVHSPRKHWHGYGHQHQDNRHDDQQLGEREAALLFPYPLNHFLHRCFPSLSRQPLAAKNKPRS